MPSALALLVGLVLTAPVAQSLGRGSLPRRRRSAARLAVQFNEEDFFQEVLDLGRVASKTKLRRLSSQDRGLYAARALRKGDEAAAVPLSTCLSTDAQGAVVGLNGQTEAMWGIAGDLRQPVKPELAAEKGLTWDVRLSLALVEAGGNMLYGRSANLNPFWDAYCLLFPGPRKMLVPLCLPDCILAEAGHPRLQTDARAHRDRLRRLFPALILTEEQEENREAAFAQGYIGLREDAPPFPLSPLEWAAGAVRSRTCQIADDFFALTPVLDMVNHGPEPNVNFRLDQNRQQVVIYALRDVGAGEELTLRYLSDDAVSGGASLSRMMLQYGFVPALSEGRESLGLWEFMGTATGVRLPLLAVRPAVLKVLSEEHTRVTNSALENKEERAPGLRLLADFDRQLQAVMSELTALEPGETREAEGASETQPDAIRAKARLWYDAVLRADEALVVNPESRVSSMARRAATRLCEDEVQGDPAAPPNASLQEFRDLVDPRLLGVIRYRYRRQTLLATTKRVLEGLME